MSQRFTRWYDRAHSSSCLFSSPLKNQTAQTKKIQTVYIIEIKIEKTNENLNEKRKFADYAALKKGMNDDKKRSISKPKIILISWWWRRELPLERQMIEPLTFLGGPSFIIRTGGKNKKVNLPLYASSK